MIKKSILFVGNSYTYYNAMPEKIFYEIAKERGYELDITSVTHGGYKLSQFADPSDEEYKRLCDTVRGKCFDCIVLQDQSCNPVKDKDAFVVSVGNIKDMLSQNSGTFVLYATWGRKEGSPMLSELGLDTIGMTEGLSISYNLAAEKYGMSVAEVGKAFLEHTKKYPDDELYNADKSHPSELGSRIAAKTIFEAVAKVI